MIFKNEVQLRNFLLSKCKNAVAQAEEKVHRAIDDCLNQFYGEFTPAEYIRTKQLFHSLVRTGVMATGNGYEAEIYFDAGQLNYQTGYVPLQSGNYGWATWDGETVLNVAMTSGVPHGGYQEGTAIWTKSMDKLGDITELLLQELRAQGIPIK